MLLILIAIAAASLLYYFMAKRFNYWRDRGVKQGNPVWIAGDNWGVLSGRESFAEMAKRVYDHFPGARYSGMYQLVVPALVIKDPDLIKQIMIKDFDHFVDHTTFIPEDGDPLWGKNLISLKGQKWRDMRAILSPSFTSSKMKAMFSLMSECAENFVQHFLKKNEEVTTVEFKDIFTRFTNDVIASTAFGIEIDSMGEPNNQFYLMGKEATDFRGFWKGMKFFGFFLFPKIFSLLKIPFTTNAVNSFFTKVVSDTIKMREEKRIVRPDMINLLLEAKRGTHKHEENGVIDAGFSVAEESDFIKANKQYMDISDTDITAQAMIFFFAGFESVSGLMCFLAYELTVNQDIQERLREEVRSTFDECEGKITYEAILKMKYLDMVISEALRKWPLNVATDRVCTKPYTIEPKKPDEEPLPIAKGTLVWFPIYGIQRDPENFPDPERFDPERFSDENISKIKPGSYLPFGLGPRNCIGSRFALLETKIVFFHILQHYELVPVGKSVIPLQIAKRQFNFSAEGGFWFGLKRINA